jgi:hypothetical protein
MFEVKVARNCLNYLKEVISLKYKTKKVLANLYIQNLEGKSMIMPINISFLWPNPTVTSKNC